jgi:thiol-disulfide isomerase/thioredoxin
MKQRTCVPLFGMVLVLTVAVCLNAIVGCGGKAESESFPCGPKVLIFHAEWCHWCPTTAEINKLQTDHPDCEIVDIDIDKYPELKEEYHVTKVPRFFICDESGCRTTTSFSELKRWLNEIR